jgi:alkyl hydroperoxide reductase subunit AhpC
METQENATQMPRIGDIAPNFTAKTTKGDITLHD